MAVHYTPLTNGDDANAATFNSRLQEFDDVLEGFRDGSVALTAPTLSSMTNAQHDHEDAAGGGKLSPAAIDSSGQTAGDVLVADGAGGHIHQGSASIPTGTGVPFFGSTAPSGWLLCNGAAISRATYASLFAIIGTTYGLGDGSTTFNLPDARGRVLSGLDNMGGTAANTVTNAQADVLGGAMGEETHTLTIEELASHAHVYTKVGGSGGAGWSAGGQDANYTYNTTSKGGNVAHNNMQPTLFANYIIKA